MGKADAQAVRKLSRHREKRARCNDHSLFQTLGVGPKRVYVTGQFYPNGQPTLGRAHANLSRPGVKFCNQAVTIGAQLIALPAQMRRKAAISHKLGNAMLEKTAAGQLGDQLQVLNSVVPSRTGDPPQTQIARKALGEGTAENDPVLTI